MSPGNRYPDIAPHRVGRPAVTQVWEDVTMLHWRTHPAVVDARLPAGLRADVHDGSGWVSLVPFRMSALTVPGVPPVPYLSRFCETNIRTYVDGPDGPGIWFESLDIPRIIGLPVARIGFGQPYTWAGMRIARRGSEIRYLSTRNWPGPRGARCHVGVRIGAPITPDDTDRFLLNRWAAYSMIRGRLAYARVVHDPWPAHHAEITALHDDLGAAVGLPLGVVERAHFAAAAASVRFEWPTRYSG